MPVSARKLAANRANAKKSKGPVTDQGKAISSQNRLKHGLAGQFQVLDYESQEEFDRFLDLLVEDEKPVGLAERELVLKMAQHIWMSKRAIRCQEACFSAQPTTAEQKKRGEQAIGIRSDLDVYLRYHAAQDRAYQRAAKELLERRKQRLKEQVGFERQKQVRAEENRKAELHAHKVKAARARAEREKTNANLASVKLGEKMAALLPPGTEIPPELLDQIAA